ncbi:MAG: hypothetical protein HQL17_06970 [Candidatus Omnitrophica bacterium]|nr:hypothetical protein [Candidatus Omnitrophota bacterium]
MRKVIAFITLAVFLANTFVPPSYAQTLLSKPGEMVVLSPSFHPAMLSGVKVYADNPLRFDFILDKGDEGRDGDAGRLIKYFLAALTVPEKDLWVNLSPYEKDRIVPEAFGRTEMGRDLLAQDYFLKQLTASLMYPEGDLGRKFWSEVYKLAQAKFGTTDIPVDTFNKVWIMPAKAVVFEKKDAVYVVGSRLKVMLESDYLAMDKNGLVRTSEGSHVGDGPHAIPNLAGIDTHELSKELIRQIILPALEKEVNEGKNFAQLRQVYNSLILAVWYKRKIQESLLGKVYVDQKKVTGVNIPDPQEAGKIWAQYVEAFNKGAYNFIKDEKDPVSGDDIARRYFSGGVGFENLNIDHAASLPKVSGTDLFVVTADMSMADVQDKILPLSFKEEVAALPFATDQAQGQALPMYLDAATEQYLRANYTHIDFLAARKYFNKPDWEARIGGLIKAGILSQDQFNAMVRERPEILKAIFSYDLKDLSSFILQADGRVDNIVQRMIERTEDKKIRFLSWNVASKRFIEGFVRAFGVPLDKRVVYDLSGGELGDDEPLSDSLLRPNVAGYDHYLYKNMNEKYKQRLYIDTDIDWQILFKYYLDEATLSSEKIAEYRQKMKIAEGRPIVVCSVLYSAREMKKLIDLIKSYPQEKRPLFVVGLRHEGVVAQWGRQLAQAKLAYLVRRQKDKFNDQGSGFSGLADGEPMGTTDVVLLSAQGELLSFYAMAKAAILGNGRNYMEPVSQKVPAILLDWDTKYNGSSQDEVNHSMKLFLNRHGAVVNEDKDLLSRLDLMLNDSHQRAVILERMQEARDVFLKAYLPADKLMAALKLFKEKPEMGARAIDAAQMVVLPRYIEEKTREYLKANYAASDLREYEEYFRKSAWEKRVGALIKNGFMNTEQFNSMVRERPQLLKYIFAMKAYEFDAFIKLGQGDLHKVVQSVMASTDDQMIHFSSGSIADKRFIEGFVKAFNVPDEKVMIHDVSDGEVTYPSFKTDSVEAYGHREKRVLYAARAKVSTTKLYVDIDTDWQVLFKYYVNKMILSPVQVNDYRQKMKVAADRPIVVSSIFDSRREMEKLIGFIDGIPKGKRPLFIVGLRRTVTAIDWINHLKKTGLTYVMRGQSDMHLDALTGFTGAIQGRPMGNVDVVLLTSQGELMTFYAMANAVILGNDRNYMEPVSQMTTSILLDKSTSTFLDPADDVNFYMEKFLVRHGAMLREDGDLGKRLSSVLGDVQERWHLQENMQKTLAIYESTYLEADKFMAAVKVFQAGRAMDKAQKFGGSIAEDELSPELGIIARNMRTTRKLSWEGLWQYPDGTIEATEGDKVVWAAIKSNEKLAQEYKSNYVEVFRVHWSTDNWYQIKLGNVRIDDDHGYDPSGLDWFVDQNDVLNLNNLYFKDRFQGEKIGAGLFNWLSQYAARKGIKTYRNSNTFNPVALYLILKTWGSSDAHFSVGGKASDKNGLLAAVGRLDVVDRNDKPYAAINITLDGQGRHQLMFNDKVAVYQQGLSSDKERVYSVVGMDGRNIMIKVVDQIIVRVFDADNVEYKVVYSKGVVVNAQLKPLEPVDKALTEGEFLSDKAMQAPGGIDLNPAAMGLDIKSSSGAGISFNIDPGLLEKLKLADGFVPVIINVQPLINLNKFLGVN